MDAMNSLPVIILYEPRILLRRGLTTRLQDEGHQVVSCTSTEQLTEEICLQTGRPRVLLVGVGGLGNTLLRILRTLHATHKLSLKTLVYLPQRDDVLARMFKGAGASHCLTEDELESQLLSLIPGAVTACRRGVLLTPSELNVLIDYASGLQASEIAVRRNCSYKTVSTIKLLVRNRLNIETKSSWVNLLTHIDQLTSLYK
ncbi:hypothetical protein FCH31_11190 [Lelliottia amnigena]|nr:hypothetical protein [Lelliottia amnigena]